MKKIDFNKSYIADDGCKFTFRYEGMYNEHIDIAAIEEKLDKFVNTNYHYDMVRNVAFLRTILKNFEEKLLIVSYESKEDFEIVKYDNESLFLFEKSKKKYVGEELKKQKIKYESHSGIKFDFCDTENDVAEYPYKKNISETVFEIMNYIYQLKHTKSIELDRDSKALIEIYKLFYNENPNFNDKNINVRVQTMMSILAEFGISLGDDYAFSLWGKVKMPVSLQLEQVVNKLYPFGEISDVDDSVILEDGPKKIIKIVGETVRETISDGYRKDNALITISKVIHARRYNLSSNIDVHNIAEYTNRSTNEVEFSIRLVKRIETKLKQNKDD